MLVLEDIAQLVAYALSLADALEDIAMGVAIDPVVDSTLGNEVTQFDC